MRNDARTAGALLTVEETARELRLTRGSVYRKIARHEIPFVKLGAGPRARLRVPAAALTSWLCDDDPDEIEGDE